MKKVIVLILLSTCFFSCKRKKEEIIIKQWQAIAVENPDMQGIMKQQQEFIDTVGKNTDAAANKELYGVGDIDSLRKELQMQLDSFKIMQDAAIKNTQFNFLKDGKAIVNFGGGQTDTCTWRFENDSTLLIDAIKGQGPADKIKMHVVQLTDTMMKLQLNEENTKSTVTFIPGKK